MSDPVTRPESTEEPAGRGLHVGYILKQYPRLSETFILNEILGLEEHGTEVSIFSLRHATEGRFHPGIGSVEGTVRYLEQPDKGTLLDALRALPGLRVDRLGEALEFVDRLAPEHRSRLLLNAIEIAAAARRGGVDHLHAHFLTVASHTAHVVGLLTGIPYTVTAHAKDIYRHTVDWEIAGRVGGGAAAVVTVCDANLRYLVHRLDGSGAKVVRIHNGLGPQDPPTSLDEREPELVLGLGRLVEKKGFDVLLDAVAVLADSRPGLRVVIVGDGDQGEALRSRAIELGIGDRVTFTGPLPQQHVAAWLRRARVLVAPCRVGTDGNQDALPTVLIEALGAGLPSISTPVAGIPEIVGHHREGILVDPDDVEATAAAVDGLLADDALWRRLSAAGPVKLASTFDRADTIAQLVATFRTAVMVA